MKKNNNINNINRKELLVMLATYNEEKNIKKMIKSLRALPVNFDILVVDDNSPDGTGDIVKKMSKKNKGIYLISRPEKIGVGSAHLEGIRYAYKNKYKKILTLDCDFSHDPKLIPDIIELGLKYDIVTTNRFSNPVGLQDWARHRKLLTKVAKYLIFTLLRIPYDSTGAFRLYNIYKIELSIFNKIVSKSYSFFWESMYLLWKNNYSITEKSIVLPARTYGSSKMKLKDIFSSLKFLLIFFIRTIFYPKCFRVEKKKLYVDKRKNTEDEWNKYWTNKNKAEKKKPSLYDIIADIYRKFLIRPNLDRFINRHFIPGSILIHAGCGSGEVDSNIVNKMQIKAIDISKQALEIYKKKYYFKADIIKASIYKLPFKNNEVDGIYNLGVMEHFSKGEIEKILKEFNRVTKVGGKIVLFWPPVYGVSVIALHIIHAFMKYVLNNNSKLHPEEPNKIRSKRSAFKLLKNNGFKPKEWSFSARDFFTYAVVVGEKTKNKLD